MKEQNAAARKANESFGKSFESYQSGSRNRKPGVSEVLNAHHSYKVNGSKNICSLSLKTLNC